MAGHLFWGYANIAFDILIIFIVPLALALRELILLRRFDRGTSSDQPRRDPG